MSDFENKNIEQENENSKDFAQHPADKEKNEPVFSDTDKENSNAAETLHTEPAEYTYSYGAFGTKENVTSRFRAPADNISGTDTYDNTHQEFGSYNSASFAQSMPHAPEGDQANRQTYAQNGFETQNKAPNYGQANYNMNRPSYGQDPYKIPQMHRLDNPNTSQHGKNNKKSKGTIKTTTAVMLCVACILLSFAVSILGSSLVYTTVKSSSETTPTNNGNSTVMYQDVETKNTGNTSVSAIVDKVADTVVEITTEYVTNNNYFFGQYITNGAGSGVIISDDGYIVTNNHVICDTDNNNKAADSIKVRLRNGSEYSATIIGTDSDADIALIKIEAEESDKITAAVWGNSDNIVVGEQVVAVGNPLGSLGGTLTVGYISAKSREVEINSVKMTLIQTDAAVNPGNSGGGLFDLNGNLIGIVNAKSSGTDVDGLGFAIPSNDAKDTVEQLLEYGYVKGRVFIGVSFYEYNSGFYSSDGASGMLMVYGTEKGYNDDVLASGDIILSLDGNDVSSVADVKAILKKHSVGDKISASILRNKTALDVEIKCFEYNPSDSEVSFEQ